MELGLKPWSAGCKLLSSFSGGASKLFCDSMASFLGKERKEGPGPLHSLWQDQRKGFQVLGPQLAPCPELKLKGSGSLCPHEASPSSLKSWGCLRPWKGGHKVISSPRIFVSWSLLSSRSSKQSSGLCGLF